MRRLSSRVLFSFIATRWILIWMCPVVYLLSGCQTTEVASPKRSSYESGPTQINSHQPLTHQQIQDSHNPFAGRLPLGIGARLDVFFSETSDNVSSFYASYLQPIRRGRLFGQQPFQLDYSILPKKGESFDQTAPLSNVSLRSDYDLRIGVTRRFQNLTDFFDMDFLLARGKYSPTSKSTPLPQNKDIIPLFTEKPPLSIKEPYQGPVLDLEELIPALRGTEPDQP